MTINIKTIFLKIAPSLGARNISLNIRNTDKENIVYDITDSSNQIIPCILTINYKENSINITNGVNNYKIIFKDSIDPSNIISIQQKTSQIIIPKFDSKADVPGYYIDDSLYLNNKLLNSKNLVLGGGILDIKDNLSTSCVKEVQIPALSLIKLDLSYNNSSKNATNNLQMQLVTPTVNSSYDLNNVNELKIEISSTGELSMKTRNSEAVDMISLMDKFCVTNSKPVRLPVPLNFNILLNQDNFKNFGGKSFSPQAAYIVSQSKYFSGVNRTTNIMQAASVNPPNFNSDIIWMTYNLNPLYALGMQAYNNGGYNRDLTQVLPATVTYNNESGQISSDMQLFYSPMIQIKKTLLNAGTYKLDFIRRATNINNQKISNYSTYAFYNAPVGGLLYGNFNGQGYGTGFGFLNIAPQLANNNLDLKTDIMTTLIIKCSSMDWDYNSEIDNMALLNTRVTLSIKEFVSLQGVGLDHAWLWYYLPSLASQLSVLANFY